MAKAQFNSLRGEKSVLIMVKRNALERGGAPAYVSRAGVFEIVGKELTNDDKGLEFEIPDGYKFHAMSDENGEALTSKDGAQLHELRWE